MTQEDLMEEPGAILCSPEIQAVKADVGLNSIWKDFILAAKS